MNFFAWVGYPSTKWLNFGGSSDQYLFLDSDKDLGPEFFSAQCKNISSFNFTPHTLHS